MSSLKSEAINFQTGLNTFEKWNYNDLQRQNKLTLNSIEVKTEHCISSHIADSKYERIVNEIHLSEEPQIPD